MAGVTPGYLSGKWVALRDALAAILAESKDATSFGLELFPARTVASTCNGDECCMLSAPGAVNVGVELGTDALPKVLTTLNQVVPGGETPTAAAIDAALDYFVEGAGASLSGTKLVLLVTDGGANCNTEHAACDAEDCTFNIDERAPCSATSENCCTSTTFGTIGCLDDLQTVSLIKTMRQNAIRTVVIALPGSEPYSELLDVMAYDGDMINPGNPPFYYRPDSAEALTETLRSVMRSLVESCQLALPFEPPDTKNIAIGLDCVLLEAKDDVTGAPRWVYDPGPPPAIRVLGRTCQELTRDGALQVDAVFGCASGGP